MRRNRAAFDRWAIVPRMPLGSPTGTCRRAARHHARDAAAAGADRGRGPGPPRQRSARSPVPPPRPAAGYVFSNQGCEPDGGVRRGDGRHAALVAALLEHATRPGRHHDPAGRGRRGRRAGRHAGHHRARLAAAGPQPRLAAVRPGAWDRAVHLRPALPEIVARADPARPPAGGRTSGHLRRHPLPAVDVPQPTRRLLANLRSPVPRASVETFLDIYSNPGLSWAHLETLRGRTRLPIVLKGILHPDDARPRLRPRRRRGHRVQPWRAPGRQRRSPRSTPCVDIREALGPDPTLLLDSGIRTGADVFTALALGANAVLLGRPHIYGLAIAGQRGVEEVIANVVAELDLTMALTGVRDIASITPDRVQESPTRTRRLGRARPSRADRGSGRRTGAEQRAVQRLTGHAG